MDGVLLVHAFPVDARMWDRQVDGLREDGVAVAAPNLPGFGDALPATGGVLTMHAGAEKARRALDDAGIDRAVVVGLSMGGYVAFELWRSARDRVLGLVLAHTRAEADPPEGAQRRRDLARRLGEQGNVLVGSPPPLLSEGADEGLWNRVLGMIADQTPEAIAAASLGMAERPDSTADLATIDVPTAVITASGDTLIPPDVTAAIADAVPGATLTTLEGAGHLSNLEAPDAFDAALREHLARCGLVPA